MKPGAETDHHRDAGRSDQCGLCAAEGVLVALRHCSLDEAFQSLSQWAPGIAATAAPKGLGKLAEAATAIAFDKASFRDVDLVVCLVIG